MSSATCDKNKNGHNVRMIKVAVACWHASRRAACMVTLIGQHSETKLGLIPTAPKEAVFQRRLLQCHRPLQAGIRYLGAELIDTLPHGHNTCYTWQCPNTQVFGQSSGCCTATALIAANPHSSIWCTCTCPLAKLLWPCMQIHPDNQEGGPGFSRHIGKALDPPPGAVHLLPCCTCCAHCNHRAKAAQERRAILFRVPTGRR
jgi:hypothetical protein